METSALVQRRLGMPALRDFQRIFAPLLECFWVDAEIHEAALTGLLAAGRRNLSLVDCASFQIMHRHGIQTAAAFDADFAREGFRVLPGNKARRSHPL